MERHIYTVSSLTRDIKELLEISFPRLWVEGEISNFKRHSSGHLYFTLKDESTQIRCAMWRFKAGELLFRPEDGMKVLLEADLQVYERAGNYQLIVYQLKPAGIGELQLAFEQLKKRLHAEGMFNEERKKELPLYPENIGIITSPTGAAIRDIISVIHRRSPAIQLYLYPVKVQGEGAAEEIAEAIEDFNDFGQVEVLIISRGGGSLEDLWAFNEEIVARAIDKSALPIISAVGHEIDYSIADFVADKRAPTPSAAAELVVRDRQELLGILAYFQEKFSTILKQKIVNFSEQLQSLKRSYGLRRPEDLLYQKMQQVDDITRNFQIAYQHHLEINKQRLENVLRRLQALSPLEVLGRGYSICYKDGELVKDVAQLKIEDLIQIKLSNGKILSQVKKLEQ